MNKLSPGSLDWATWWSLDDEKQAALHRELQPYIDQAKATN